MVFYASSLIEFIFSAKVNELTRDLQDAQHQLSVEKQGSKESETRLKQSIEERVSSRLIYANFNFKNYDLLSSQFKDAFIEFVDHT